MLGIAISVAAITGVACSAADNPSGPDTTEMAFSLEGANAAIGRRLFIQCQACHTLGEGQSDETGPNLWGLVGRAAGGRDEFSYSDALVQAEFVWTAEKLDQFLTNPAAYVPGTTMVFAGIQAEQMRRDLLAYIIGETTSAADE